MIRWNRTSVITGSKLAGGGGVVHLERRLVLLRLRRRQEVGGAAAAAAVVVVRLNDGGIDAVRSEKGTSNCRNPINIQWYSH